MPLIRGYLDARMRPRIRLAIDNGSHIDLLIDTGFNGQMFLGETTARNIGVILVPLWRSVTVAGGGQPIRVQQGEIVLDWPPHGQHRRVSVFVYSPEPALGRGEPQGLLGMGLIHPDRLAIDCLNGDVQIST